MLNGTDYISLEHCLDYIGESAAKAMREEFKKWAVHAEKSYAVCATDDTFCAEERRIALKKFCHNKIQVLPELRKEHPHLSFSEEHKFMDLHPKEFGRLKFEKNLVNKINFRVFI